jgi:NAD(P)-dependent dehydrogenase (short-subunit alcohol dehydrogenase family)
VELNLNAAFHCCLLARSRMRRDERHGRIINVSSIFGHLGSSMFRLSAYAASKGGIENLTRQLAVEWAAEGITVNAIAPAWFPSEMTAGSIEKPEWSINGGRLSARENGQDVGVANRLPVPRKPRRRNGRDRAGRRRLFSMVTAVEPA